MFFMKNEKKKRHPMLAFGVGALAIYGAYSAVKGAKDACVCKMSAMKNMFKKNDTECCQTDMCGMQSTESAEG